MAGSIQLKESDFKKLSKLIYNKYGIQMPPAKKVLIESRLQKRLIALSLNSFKDYCDYLFSSAGAREEIPHFVNNITTNKTDFFREPKHFDYLVETILPGMISSRKSTSQQLRIWSAGCSTGEEPYTLAMVLSDFMEKFARAFSYFSILASDISDNVLNFAANGLYPEERITPVPMTFRKKYFLKSKDRNTGLVKIKPEIRHRVQFKKVNFMDREFNIKEKQDIIFCRNVIIYFDRKTQETLINKFCRYLVAGGYIFLGHSETLYDTRAPLTTEAPTIYRKIG